MNENLNMTLMPSLFKLISKFNAIPIKISSRFLKEINIVIS